MNGRFQNIINSEKPVLVDFYADWCGPCKQVPPILKKVKDDFKEQIRIIKVNVDKNPVIATKYNIRSVPTLIVFKKGTLQWKGTGVRNVSELNTVIRQQINGE